MNNNTLEGKFENPIVIRLGENQDVIMNDGFSSHNYPINPGCAFGEGHYGFVIIAIRDGVQKKDKYPTISSIYGIQLDDRKNRIVVIENGMYHPWEFDREGNLIVKAHFAPSLRSEIQKASEEYGLTPETHPEFFSGKVEKKSSRR